MRDLGKKIKALQNKKDILIKDGIAQKAEIAKETSDKDDFLGFNWAPGIATMFYGDNKYISNLRIEQTGTGEELINTIYIDKEVNTNIALVLETHYLFELPSESGRPHGLGPFIATNIVKQEGDPLTMLSVGVLYAVKNKGSSNAFSIGLGLFIDTDFISLRDGLTDGSITTYTDSAKAVQKNDESGVILMFSSRF